MSAKNTFTVGEKVSLKLWDKYERPVNRMGDCVITNIKNARCESGVMVTVKSADGSSRDLDSNWLAPIERDLFT